MAAPLTAQELRDILAEALDGAANRLRARRVEVPAARPQQVATEPAQRMPEGRLALSIGEAADSLGIGRSSVYALMRSGDFPVLRLGRRTLIPVEGLNRWVASQTQFTSY